MSNIQKKFAATRRELNAALIERSDEIDLVLTALIAQEHPLLVGPPGTAKSLLLDSLVKWLSNDPRPKGKSKAAGKAFSILFTKFTTPEEVFGPISVQGLKADTYRRITTGKLPEADFAFADEIFKASSAILNTMLRILNERMYENGDGSFHQCPLLICVAASNEWPGEDGGKELGALFDRFLFRKAVKPIRTADGRMRLLWTADHRPHLSTHITRSELSQASDEARKLPWSVPAKDALVTILEELNKEGIFPGDRRQYKSVNAARAYAYLCGADQVEPEHLEILAHTLWDDPTEQPEKVAKVIAKVANPIGMMVTANLLMAEDVVRTTDPTDAVPKLQAIQKELERSGDDPRVVRARKVIAGYIKDLYNKVIGVSE